MEHKEIVYIIPANAKRSQLIFGYFRPLDLGIFLTGVFLSLIFLVAIGNNGLSGVIIKLLPGCVATFLVLPLPNYHNVRVFIRELYEYLVNRKIYIWKGWCFTSDFTSKES